MITQIHVPEISMAVDVDAITHRLAGVSEQMRLGTENLNRFVSELQRDAQPGGIISTGAARQIAALRDGLPRMRHGIEERTAALTSTFAETSWRLPYFEIVRSPIVLGNSGQHRPRRGRRSMASYHAHHDVRILELHAAGLGAWTIAKQVLQEITPPKGMRRATNDPQLALEHGLLYHTGCNPDDALYRYVRALTNQH